jgi:anti-sigma B factor antagonist
MEVGERRQGEILVLTPIGRIDNDTSPGFQARLLAAMGTNATAVLVDMAGVAYISSAGLRTLMVAAKQSKATRKRLAVAELQPVVKEIFEISRFSYVVSIFEASADAFEAWR